MDRLSDRSRRALHVHLTELGQGIQIAGVRQALRFIEQSHGLWLEARLGRIGIWNDRLSLDPHDE